MILIYHKIYGLQESLSDSIMFLEVQEYPKDKMSIRGYSHHKVVVNDLMHPPAYDEIWVAKMKNVPNLIFPQHLYFLMDGIPMEIVQQFDDIIFKWGVSAILPISSDDDIFHHKAEGYTVSVDYTAMIIREGIHFVRTYEPKNE